MNIYLDTSGLLKLVVEEDDSDLMETLWNDADAVSTNRLAYPEARAALAAANRLGWLSRPGLRKAKAGLETRWRELRIVELGAEPSLAAGELAEQYGLPGYAAVHLGSALLFGERLVFVTWDRELSAAAERAGLAVAPTRP